MPSITTYAPRTPTDTQIITGPGTLQAAFVSRPSGYGASDYEFTVYDSAGGGDISTPILTQRSNSPMLAGATSDGAHGLSIAFTKGLLIRQKTQSSITVQWIF